MAEKQFSDHTNVDSNEFNNTVSASGVKSQAESTDYDHLQTDGGHERSSDVDKMEIQEHGSLQSPQGESAPESHSDEVFDASGAVLAAGQHSEVSNYSSPGRVTVASGQTGRPVEPPYQAPAAETTNTRHTISTTVLCLALGVIVVSIVLIVIAIFTGVFASLEGKYDFLASK